MALRVGSYKIRFGKHSSLISLTRKSSWERDGEREGEEGQGEEEGRKMEGGRVWMCIAGIKHTKHGVRKTYMTIIPF